MTESELKALSEIGEAAVNADEALVGSLQEPLRLMREAALCLHNATRANDVANVGKALWRLLDAAGHLAEICPREVYDPTQPTGRGFALLIVPTDEELRTAVRVDHEHRYGVDGIRPGYCVCGRRECPDI